MPIPGDKKPDPSGKPSGPEGQPQEARQSPMRGVILWVMVLAAMVLILHLWFQDHGKADSPNYYPDFVDLVEGGIITQCNIIAESGGGMYIECEAPETDKEKEGKFRKVKVHVTEWDKVQALLTTNNVAYKNVPKSPIIWDIVSAILPAALLFAVLYFVFIRHMRASGSGVMGFGRSKAKLLARDTKKVTFDNVAGIDEAKEEVQEIIAFLKDPKKFQKLGGRMPKGVLLTGPPGTGKTLLAKAIAGEADVPFFSISGSDFVEMFVGVGASRVRDMFEQGKKNAPCLIFIDEIDAVGRSRFSGIGGGHDEREQTLNALLVEMDGFETSEGVMIIAATNRPDVLDLALLRPGRFDRQVVLDLPMLDGREAILKMHAKKIRLDAEVDLRRIARGTPGFSGADLENLLNEAALLGARAGKSAVEMEDLEEARDKVRWGRENKGRVLDEADKEICAHHETGHALVAKFVEESEPVHKITIIPRGRAYLGATMQLPEKDRYIESKTKINGMLAMLMGGRAAEELVFGEMTTGARSDFREATRIARMMVCEWGMSETLAPRTFGAHEELLFLGREVSRQEDYSEETARKIDEEVSRILEASYRRAKSILTEKRAKLEVISKALLERETLDGVEVDELLEHGRVLSDEERKAKAAEKEKEEENKSEEAGAGEREKATGERDDDG